MMGRFVKLATLFAAPLLLSGCFLIPGKFVSSLDLRKDGNFTFAYKGELIFQSPDEAMKSGGSEPEVWSDDQATCYGSDDTQSAAEAAAEAAKAAADAAEPAGAIAEEVASEAVVDDSGSRPCTKAEIAEQKSEWEENRKSRAASKKKDNDAFATLFGYNPGDEESNRRFAARLMKFDGWKSATYQGKGKFLVDYQMSGKIGHDFVFPIMPEGDALFPFVQVRKRESGKVLVNTPALVGGGMMAMWARVGAFGAGSGDKPNLNGVVDGVFTLTTDAAILTNNSEDGPSKTSTGQSIVWKIDSSGKRIPEALIQLQ